MTAGLDDICTAIGPVMDGLEGEVTVGRSEALEVVFKADEEDEFVVILGIMCCCELAELVCVVVVAFGLFYKKKETIKDCMPLFIIINKSKFTLLVFVE